VFILGLLDLPVFRTVGEIGLYPFAQVYELFVVLLLIAEAATLAASLIPVPRLGSVAGIGPNEPQIQAALGVGIAASFVALTFYDPQGENGYYYLSDRNLPGPKIDSEAIKKKIAESETNSDNSMNRENSSLGAEDENIETHFPGASQARANGPVDPKYEYNWTRSDLTFEDIGGYYDVKQRLAEEILQPIRATARGDDRYDRFGIEPSRGVLFYGPPGTGKTMFARALAGELGVPFVELGPADVTSKWINEGPQRVRQLFVEAASMGPCVIFLDEAEHLFGGRDIGAGGAHAEDRKITSELLVHLTAEDRTAIVVGASNRPEDIDPAILRPGRLATHVEIGLPGEESRHAIFQSKLSSVPHDLTGGHLARLASQTVGYTGADIEKLVTDAKRGAARRDARTVALEDFPPVEEIGISTRDADPPDRDWVDAPQENLFDDNDPGVGFQ
jgi:SpoVK/Ycf46/Vps4 family AAA+-type ATPase